MHIHFVVVFCAHHPSFIPHLPPLLPCSNRHKLRLLPLLLSCLRVIALTVVKFILTGVFRSYLNFVSVTTEFVLFDSFL
ncbi:unnamed protein product [Caenorhabditis nigoni]